MVRLWSLLLCAFVLWACGGSGGVPRYFPVPEDAQNPIVIEYSAATVVDVTNIVAKVCSDIPIATAQVRPNDGYVETRWSDIASFALGTQAATYPLAERSVVYAFEARGIDNRGVLQIAGFYQPTRPRGTPARRDSRYDRLLPTDHPGYQLALELEWRLKREFEAHGVTVIETEQEG